MDLNFHRQAQLNANAHANWAAASNQTYLSVRDNLGFAHAKGHIISLSHQVEASHSYNK